jgi:general secretion pathway protein J
MKRQGFTLIEVLLAILILGTVLTTVYASYTGTFRLIQSVSYEAEIYGMARTALDRIARDLQAVAPWRAAFTFKSVPHTLGSQDFPDLIFRSAAHAAFSDRGVPGAVAVIEYRVERDDQEDSVGYTLFRGDSLLRNPDREETAMAAGGYPLCKRIESLTYLFFDETGKEYVAWDSASDVEAQKKRAPAVVEIRLDLVNEADRERPYRFLTRVRLPFNRVEAS